MEHADHIEAYAKKLEWSELEVVTPATQEQFYKGLDIVDGYRGDPKKLFEALNAFQQIPSKPFAMAGAIRKPDNRRLTAVNPDGCRAAMPKDLAYHSFLKNVASAAVASFRPNARLLSNPSGSK